MTKVVTSLYTFLDEETGVIADTVAPNESAARLSLGGDWILSHRCPLFSPPVDVGEWHDVVEKAPIFLRGRGFALGLGMLGEEALR